MPTVVCSRTDCLNHGLEVCMANRVEWRQGQCSGYITSWQAMKANAPPIERKHGAFVPKQGRPIR
ncbi:hypothetical protein SPTER_27460 [Sporomusa termitida]|uniref:Uncharacterized protein n=1 Tax=Sporomusa termitida TaxID=2377 RepID=A0A517DVL2_9FIRM|nr:hypothetical protein SPTER_27460 [Sporomusa termitida]